MADVACADCAHWFQPASHLPRSRGTEGKGRCDHLEDSDMVWVDAWEKDGVWTSPDFGCSLSKQREVQNGD